MEMHAADRSGIGLSKASEGRRVALLITGLGSFLVPFMGSAVNIAIPVLGREFEVDAVTLGWVASSYLLAAGIFILPLGRLADIHGRKRVFTYGIIVFTISSLLCAVSKSPIQLISFRFLQGIGGAMIFCTSVALLTSIFQRSERGEALGVNVAAIYLGLSIGPLIGGFLVQFSGWRGIFLAVIPPGLAATTLTWWSLKGEWAKARGERFDLTGSIFYTFGLASIVYSLSTLPDKSGLPLLLIGGLGLVFFILWEGKVTSPILNLHIFKGNPAFTFSNLAALISYSATFAVSFLLSLYLQYIRGFPPQNAGIILMSQPVVQAILSPFAGKLSDVIEPRIVSSIGMAITTIGLAALAFIGGETALAFVIVELSILGFGFALFSSPNTNAVMNSVENKFFGVASGILATMRLIGQMLSMVISTLILTLYLGETRITPEHYPALLGSIKLAFLAFTLLSVIGIPASLARGKILTR